MNSRDQLTAVSAPTPSTSLSHLSFPSPSPHHSEASRTIIFVLVGILLVILLAIYITKTFLLVISHPNLNAASTPTPRARKQHSRKSSSMELSCDLEAQSCTLRYQNSFDVSPSTASSMGSSWMENGDEDGQTASRNEVALRPSEERVGDVYEERADDDDGQESPLGLGKYFFEGGVGIKRYESTGRKELRKGK